MSEIENLVARLINEKKITGEEAIIILKGGFGLLGNLDLSKEEKQLLIPYYEQQFDPSKCGCHPSNGGSGMCNCTLAGPKITY